MPELSAEKEQLFAAFIDLAERELISVLREHDERFPSLEKVLSRYYAAIARVREEDDPNFREFHEVYNELCTAALILQDCSEPTTVRLEYEPMNEGCEKRFDFEVVMTEGPTRHIEVKTIHPINQDDWHKYQGALKNGRFPDNTHLILEDEWLGGELYHNAYAARSKMMDNAVIMEEKIRDCITVDGDNLTFLVLFTDGFDWSLDELEDFVFFYRQGSHYPGDPFANMEKHNVEENNIPLQGSIDCFTYVRRPKMEIRPNKVVWNVDTPNLPY